MQEEVGEEEGLGKVEGEISSPALWDDARVGEG